MVKHKNRSLPNILITGTPGTGKTSHCTALCEIIPELTHVDVNAFAKDLELYSGYDNEREVKILDDDAIVDNMEPLMAEKGKVVDTHSLVDYFPERWFDLVIILRTDNKVLYDRLVKRRYTERKIQENVQAEIMMVLFEEASIAYSEDVTQVLTSDTVKDLESNVERISQWVRAWVLDCTDVNTT